MAGSITISTSSVTLGTGQDESKLKTAPDGYSPYVRQSVSNWRVYHFHDTSERARVKQKQPTNDNLRLKPDAANLAAYLRLLREQHAGEYERIVATIRLAAPFFDDFVHREGDPETIELEWTQRGNPDTPFKAHMLSDGTLRFICLATLLLQPVRLIPDTLLIDEPELGLHPYAITVLADIFKQVAEQRQLIVSTQSVELVNELAPEDVIVVDQEEGASVFRRFTDEELSGWLEQYALDELWKRNVLGGGPDGRGDRLRRRADRGTIHQATRRPSPASPGGLHQTPDTQDFSRGARRRGQLRAVDVQCAQYPARETRRDPDHPARSLWSGDILSCLRGSQDEERPGRPHPRSGIETGNQNRRPNRVADAKLGAIRAGLSNDAYRHGRGTIQYPFGFSDCQRQASRTMSSIPCSACHPSSVRARAGSA